MIIRKEQLIKLNSKNRIQLATATLDQLPDNTYAIHRITGQYGCKAIQQPDISISAGKVKRTISEQATLQFNSIINKYKDTGYKLLKDLTSKSLDDLTEVQLQNLFNSQGVTDQSGIPKPMLAKSSNELNADIFEKDWYCSRKIDGVRCLLYMKDGAIHSASRGGKNYDGAIPHILKDSKLLDLFNRNPDLILDGELYKHGWPLQKISGLCRLQEATPECNSLQLWLFDYISDEPFEDRLKTLNKIRQELEGDSNINVIEHHLLSGFLTIKKAHNQYVSEGFEGLCARNPKKEYGVGKRSGTYLVKLKDRMDDEFEITGIREGMRPEDMCFTLKTKTGKEFAAKPACDVQTRLDYLNNKDSYIGKKATCTYFSISQDGVPTQPVFKFVREAEDLDPNT